MFQQQQRLAIKYPHSEFLISHMVSFPLRQNVPATYNSRRYHQLIRNGEEPDELMCEKWHTFDDKLVLEILVEACRPITREQCAEEFIMFVGIVIPLKFKVNADNFSRDFYEPLMKALHDLDHHPRFEHRRKQLYQLEVFAPETIPVLFKSGSFLWAFKKNCFYSY